MKMHAASSTPSIALERVYARPGPSSARTFLVDRLWPRGLRRSELGHATWLPGVAPSRELRNWFAHRLDRWPEFERRYRLELRSRPEAWTPLLAALREGPITLLYAARDTEHNNGVVLREFLLRKLHRAAAAVERERPAGPRPRLAPRPPSGEGPLQVRRRGR